MRTSHLSGLLGAVVLCALPSVSSAQYSPYYYFRHGSYYQPNMYSAPGTAPSEFAGTAMAVYGDDYSPYDYLRHGTYSMPRWYGYNSSRPTYVYAPPVYIPPSSSRLIGAEEQEVPANDTRAFIRVRVPASAEIWFEGDKTSQTGTERRFVSPALQPGRSFTYDIRARWTDASGKVIDKTEHVKVEAGRLSTVDFASAAASPAK
jgi:uncharacterized protein (TIGR03000 family)